MTIENNNSLSNQDDYLNTDNDKMQDAGNADAAKFNTDEQEQAVNQRDETENTDAQSISTGNTNKQGTTQPPLTSKGDINEVEENMGGTTNLSLDQLKKEGDPEGMDGE